MACSFAGNSDIYGIGIRIGYYSQALAVWFANYFHLGELKVLRAVNNLFIFALVIAGAIYAAEARSIYAIEAFLLLNIGICIGFVGILESSRYTSRYIRTSQERLLLRTIIINVGLIFNVCYWWKGLDVMRPTPCSEADGPPGNDVRTSLRSTYICFFVIKTNIYGWVRTFMRIHSLTGLLWMFFSRQESDHVELIHAVWLRRTKASFINAAASICWGIDIDNQHTVADEARGLSVNLCQPSMNPRENVSAMTSDASPRPRPPDPGESTSGIAEDQATRVQKARQNDEAKRSCAFFQAVHEAESYLDSVFSVFQVRKALLGRKRLIILWGGRIRFYVPHSTARESSKWPSYAWCWYIAMISIVIGKVPINVRLRLLLHKLGLSQRVEFSRLLYHTYYLTKEREPPDWKLLAIASDIQLSQAPLKKSTFNWASLAIQHLVIIVGLIVQVELTIHWNNITGLQTLSSLGQLIPFILGVGGLLQVLWGKWSLLRKGVREDSRPENQASGEYESAIAKYLQWKATEEKRTSSSTSPPPRRDEIPMQGAGNQIFTPCLGTGS